MRMADTRALLAIAAVFGTLLAPAAALAQPPAKVYRVGALSSGAPEQERTLQATLRERLRERGWVEGQNLVVDWRYAEGKYERAAALIDELLRLKPDLLMTRGGPVTTAARRAVVTIPILMWGVTDPVGIGAVAALARPGGNVTGLSDDPNPEIMGKRLQLLKEVAPALTKVAVLTRVPPSDIVPRIAAYENALEAGAKALGLLVQRWALQGPDDVGRAFAELRREGFGALNVEYVPVTWIHRRQIMDLALRHRLPAIYWHRTYAVDGGLMAYGEDEREVPQRPAAYVDKILRGARPADLPVEQPTRVEFVINLKTAKALGLIIPPALLSRADHIVE